MRPPIEGTLPGWSLVGILPPRRSRISAQHPLDGGPLAGYAGPIMKISFINANMQADSGWARLREHGGRATLPRQAIRQVLDQAEGGLRPEEIHARAARLCPGIGLVTVYRTLALFADLGWARRVHGADGCHAYVGAAQPPRQALICLVCHRTIELEAAEGLEAMLRQVERQTGFRVGEPSFELHGTCAACQRRQAPASELGGADA